ncbi:matrixin family metalloprotease [Curtobacterium sp. MCSS17_016]|uniref:matrixin family metalloprotease n=1 Tax=Curtobacterium sp. MCSS17_016 TaxID=2175644 RepID=UPI000DA73F4F|nr:matrixin family metalloprotease [Curtobacterium sp. MCSS17_016]WIE80943.1 matrixin family metalloprotease [Curtobacterium sp. MCSS17_016]
MKKPRTATATKRRRLGLTAASALALTAALIAIPNAAQAYAYENSSWGNANLRIYMASTSGKYRTAINQASANYTSATDLNLTNTTTGGPSFSAADVNNGADSYEGWTDWTPVAGRTVSAHSTVNRYYVSGKTTANLKVIWLHELGHGLGLAHVGPVARVMHNPASGAYNAGVRNLTSDEVAGINKKY